MKIEHIAFVVDDPDAVAKWYCDHLGMQIIRQGPPPIRMTFLADSEGQTMYEIYAQPTVKTTDYASMNPLALHFAFYAEDIEAEFARLKEAGATVIQEPEPTDAGDMLAMLRDPWGVCVQLVHRKEKML